MAAPKKTTAPDAVADDTAQTPEGADDTAQTDAAAEAPAEAQAGVTHHPIIVRQPLGGQPCAVDDGTSHNGSAVPGSLVCSAHTMRYNTDGSLRRPR
jgi:hypothetical protein